MEPTLITPRAGQKTVDRFGIPNPRKSGSVIGADRQRFGPSCVLLKRVPQGRTESGGIVLAANAGPRVPSGGVTLKRRCTYRPSVIYLIVNKLLSLSLSLSLSHTLSLSGSVWDHEPSKERVGDWGGPATVWSLLCVAETRATRPNGEWGYSTRRQCWATSAQRRCHPEEALYLPTFSHLFDCQ